VADFLIPGTGPYLLTHSVGCLTVAARDALAAGFVAPWAQRGGNAWPDWLGQIEGFRSALADLFGGDASEYCPQSNLSSGLVKLLLSLPASSRRTLLAAEDSFPSLGFVLRQFEKLGFVTRLIPRGQSPDDLAHWEAALTADVRVAIVTHVHSNTGRVAPVTEIANLCADRGILCVVDVAQSAGILPMQFPALGADVVLGSCIKWLCGGPGAGYLWIRRDLTPTLGPLDVGWFSHEDPFEMDIHSFRYAGDARRFWGGTPSVAPFVGAAASLRVIHRLRVDDIHAQNRQLMQRFREELPSAWRARLPTGNMGGTLCISLGADFDRIDAALKQAGVQFDSRGDVLRLSFHACNTDDDAARVARAWGDR
jgi:kynureninase